MSITLIVAILFTLAAAISLFNRRSKYWWLVTLLFTAGAAINWLRYYEILR